MSWTRPAELKGQLQKLWDRGQLLATVASGEQLFPRRLVLKRPLSRQLSEQFPQVQQWIGQLTSADKKFRIEWQTVNHRVLGVNAVPAAVWVDSFDDAIDLLGKRRETTAFAQLVELTLKRHPTLRPWLTQRPLQALELADLWPQLLDLIDWMIRHPRPAVYLRQVDIPHMHSKRIECLRTVLTELFDLTLAPETIEQSASGKAGFCRRYGFLDKPKRVRFRVLDPAIRLLAPTADQDITVTDSAFATLPLPVERVFVTENEVNFLAFPAMASAIVVFGAGYGFDSLASAHWLHQRTLFYWGDIDTHGFAILNQFRTCFPKAKSLLMDQRTLLAHRPLWGEELRPETAILTRLSADEQQLYTQLQQHFWGQSVRLEQERVGFSFVNDALHALPTGQRANRQ